MSKFLSIALMMFFLLTTVGYAQNGPEAQEEEEETAKTLDSKKVVFKNQSFSGKRIAFIYYQPSIKGNSTFIKQMFPKGRAVFNLEVGTKVYLADDSQVGLVMSGKSLVERGDKPYYVVTDEKRQVVALPL